MERGHRRLPIWTASIEMVEAVYAFAAQLPDDERFGLSAQMRRAAVSVPSNIAEGAARKGTPELIHFLHIASASLAELDTQLEIARRVTTLPEQACATLQEQLDGVHLQLMNLITSLKRRSR